MRVFVFSLQSVVFVRYVMAVRSPAEGCIHSSLQLYWFHHRGSEVSKQAAHTHNSEMKWKTVAIRTIGLCAALFGESTLSPVKFVVQSGVAILQFNCCDV